MKSTPHPPPAPSSPVTGNTVCKDPSPLAPEGNVQLANPARRVGLRQLVKAKLCTPQEALAWLRKTDPHPNPRIETWLIRKCKGVI